MKNPRLALSSLFVLVLCVAMSGPDPALSAMDKAGRAFLESLPVGHHIFDSRLEMIHKIRDWFVKTNGASEPEIG